MKNTYILTFIILFVTQLAFAEGQNNRAAEVWKNAGLTPKFITDSLSPKACHADFKAYKACFITIATIASLNDRVVKIVNGQLVYQTQEQAEAEAQAEAASSPETAPAKQMTAREYHAYVTEKREEANQKIRELQAKNPKLAFNAAVMSDLAHIMGKDDAQARLATAFNTYISFAMDPHSRMQPIYNIKETLATGGGPVYSGIGSNVISVRGQLVLSPRPNSPSQKAGVLDQDILTHVNSQPIAGKNINEATKLILGENGTKVTITVLRKGKALDLEITRGQVRRLPLQMSIMKVNDKKIGYIDINTFMYEPIAAEFLGAMFTLNLAQVDAIVFDVRGNGGGLMQQASQMVDLLVPKGGLIATLRHLYNPRGHYEIRSQSDSILNVPTVTLTDSRSASASEMFAGALQDHQKTFVLGERSFGKGSQQSNLPMRGLPNLSLWVTTHLFYQPNGRTNQMEGIIPDFTVPFKPNATEDERFAFREAEKFPEGIRDDQNKPYVQQRPEKIKSLSQCMNESGSAVKAYENLDRPKAHDFQLQSAFDLLLCQAG